MRRQESRLEDSPEAAPMVTAADAKSTAPDGQVWSYFAWQKACMSLMASGALSPTEFAVLIVVGEAADYRTGENTRLGIDTIAKRTGPRGVARASVENAMRAGRRLGLLTVTRRGGGKPPYARPTEYRLTVPNIPTEVGEYEEERPDQVNSPSNTPSNTPSPVGTTEQTEQTNKHMGAATSPPPAALDDYGYPQWPTDRQKAGTVLHAFADCLDGVVVTDEEALRIWNITASALPGNRRSTGAIVKALEEAAQYIGAEDNFVATRDDPIALLVVTAKAAARDELPILRFDGDGTPMSWKGAHA